MSRMVIDQGGLDSCTLRPSDVAGFNERLKQTDMALEDPFDSLWVMHKIIYLAARERGHLAMMSGIDGDGLASLTNSYPVYLLRDGRWLTANSEIMGMRRNFGRAGYPLWRIYADVLRAILVPDVASRIKHKLSVPNFDWMNKQFFINPDFAASQDLPARWLENFRAGNPNQYHTLRQAHVARMTAAYLTAGSERYGRLAAICGVEQRLPLLDKRLVEFCISLPWQQKVHGGWSKIGMRRVAQRMLPHEVAWRQARDQIMWKFWSAWDELNRDANRHDIETLGNHRLLVKFIDRQQLAGAESCAIIDGSLEREILLGLAVLGEWLARNQLK